MLQSKTCLTHSLWCLNMSRGTFFCWAAQRSINESASGKKPNKSYHVMKAVVWFVDIYKTANQNWDFISLWIHLLEVWLECSLLDQWFIANSYLQSAMNNSWNTVYICSKFSIKSFLVDSHFEWWCTTKYNVFWILALTRRLLKTTL